MNIAAKRATDEFPRREFTVEDIRRMMEAGVIGADENFELVEGDIVMMAAKSIGHDDIKHALNLALVRAVPDGVYVGIEASLQLTETTLVEPDIAVVSREVYRTGDRKAFARPRPQDVLLVIEIAATRMKYDREVKARLYARHGIAEYWVIDANERITWVHTGPRDEAWSSVVELGPDKTLSTPALPGFAIRLADIG